MWVNLCLAALMAVMFCGCATRNVEEVLKSVPREADNILVINLSHLNDKLRNDGVESFSTLLQEDIISGPFSSRCRIMSKDLPREINSPVIAFDFNNVEYISFQIKNDRKFRDLLKSRHDVKFSQEEGIWVSEDSCYYLAGNQVWIVNGTSKPSRDDVRDFRSLKETESALDRKGIRELIDRNADIEFLTSLSHIKNERVARLTSEISNAIFTKPAYADAYLNFEAGRLEGGLNILDPKEEPSKYRIALPEVNVDALQSYPAQGNLFLAFSTSPDIIESLFYVLKSENVDIPEKAKEIISEIDGGIVASADALSLKSKNPRIAGMIGFKDEGTAGMLEFIFSGFARNSVLEEVKTIGNSLYVVSRRTSGASFSSVSDSFRGKVAGMVLTTENADDIVMKPFSEFIRQASVMVNPPGVLPMVEVKAETKPNENAVFSLLKLYNAFK